MLIDWFFASPGARLLVGALFFASLVSTFFRVSRGQGKVIFIACFIGLLLLFTFIPSAQLFAFAPLLALLVWNELRLHDDRLGGSAVKGFNSRVDGSIPKFQECRFDKGIQ